MFSRNFECNLIQSVVVCYVFMFSFSFELECDIIPSIFYVPGTHHPKVPHLPAGWRSSVSAGEASPGKLCRASLCLLQSVQQAACSVMLLVANEPTSVLPLFLKTGLLFGEKLKSPVSEYVAFKLCHHASKSSGGKAGCWTWLSCW